MTEYLKTVATTPRNYALIVFGLVSFSLGISLFVTITVVFTLGVVLAATPFVYWIPGIDYQFTDPGSTVEVGSVSVDVGSVATGSINTLPETLVASVIGVMVCLVGLHAVNLSAWLLGGATERILTSLSE